MIIQSQNHTKKRPSMMEYGRRKTLLIPDHLTSFSDTHLFMTDKSSSIYYKALKHDLRGLEFYTSAPCLGFMIEGRESFTSFDDHELIVDQSEIIVIPKNVYLISDYRRLHGPLKAMLFFFSGDILEQFLLDTRSDACFGSTVEGPLKMKSSATVINFMKALRMVYKPSPRPSKILPHKLLELLHILHSEDQSGAFRATISRSVTKENKRNISHLMAEHFLRNLTVQDYAELSGRSLSTFTRDFRRIYKMSPKRWLIEARLQHAYQLVRESNVNITEISHMIGYDNVSHFIKTFKEHFGETPKRLRSAFLRSHSER